MWELWDEEEDFDLDEMKGNSTNLQKDFARFGERNRRWNLKGNRSNVQYIGVMSMAFSFVCLIYFVYKAQRIIKSMSTLALVFQSWVILLFLIQFISAIVLVLGIGIKESRGGSHYYLRMSSRIWSALSRFLIVFHTITISTHFFLWTISPVKTAEALYVSLVSAFTVIFLAVGVHYVKLFLIEVDTSKNLTYD